MWSRRHTILGYCLWPEILQIFRGVGDVKVVLMSLSVCTKFLCNILIWQQKNTSVNNQNMNEKNIYRFEKPQLNHKGRFRCQQSEQSSSEASIVLFVPIRNISELQLNILIGRASNPAVPLRTIIHIVLWRAFRFRLYHASAFLSISSLGTSKLSISFRKRCTNFGVTNNRLQIQIQTQVWILRKWIADDKPHGAPHTPPMH